MHTLDDLIGWTLLTLAIAAIGYTLHATVAVHRFVRASGYAPAPAEPVTLLKPLHGAEPRLAENLRTFLAQDWPAPVQMVAGANRAEDPALTVARLLGADVRTDAPVIGANAKIGNVANLMFAARHDLLVLSDSDMAVPRDYLARVAAALATPGVGAVTCVYRGRGDAGRWSVMAAAAVSYHFLPQLLVGIGNGMARPGMGSTIALRRATLTAVGGFERFADSLADDYDLCESVRGLGLRVAVPPLLLTHCSTETSLGELWRHELRWAATIRAINLRGHLGTVVTHPVPLALISLPFHPAMAIASLVAGVAARLLLKREVDHYAGVPSAPAWWLPARDLFSFAVFLASFFVARVDWRGSRLRMERNGRIAADR